MTRALAPLLRADARYVVTDLNQPMLDYAASRQGPDERIEWRQADALALPFADAAFDLVCCQFGAMFFPDRVAGYREARRVLKPGGRVLFNVWDRIEENVFADDVTNALADRLSRRSAALSGAHAARLSRPALIRRELRRAGFAQVADRDARRSSAAQPTARDAAIAYCQGTPLRNEIEARDPGLLQLATDRATQAIARRHGDGPVDGKIQAHVIVAVR